MYPMIYFNSFRQLVTGDEVFVAMPMGDPAFNVIWTDVFEAAIFSVDLRPFRVNMPRAGDSILIDVLRGLRRARLVLVDISPDSKSGELPNANVMYELGLAHAVRLPETVVVVRRGGAKIPFDIAHIRAHDYDSADLVSAQQSVASYLADALAQAASLREDLVETAWSAMDPACRDIIAVNWYVTSGRAAQVAKEKGEKSYYEPHPGLFKYPIGDWHYGRWRDAEVRSAFNRLFEFGVIENTEPRWEMAQDNQPQMLCRFTALGEAMAARFTQVT